MALLLALNQPQVESEILHQSGLTGIVAPVPQADFLSGQFNASLRQVHTSGRELYCRAPAESISSMSSLDAWKNLCKLQATLPFAKIVLPFQKQSLELVEKSAAYGWNWQIEGAKTAAQVLIALTSGAGAIWIQVGSLDGFHELEGDELCSQARSIIDERSTGSRKPLVIASDIRDLDHTERTISYGCDRIVIDEALWSSCLP
jgi:hypothetical protein